MATPATTNTPSALTTNLPSEKTLLHAARIAMEHDKPIMLDYFLPTCTGQAFLGIDSATQEKSLVKSADEYTSPIQKILGTKTEFIVITENSIYIVSGTIKKKPVSMGGTPVPALTN